MAPASFRVTACRPPTTSSTLGGKVVACASLQRARTLTATVSAIDVTTGKVGLSQMTKRVAQNGRPLCQGMPAVEHATSSHGEIRIPATLTRRN
jgi:hypothetical protein